MNSHEKLTSTNQECFKTVKKNYCGPPIKKNYVHLYIVGIFLEVMSLIGRYRVIFRPMSTIKS